MTDVDSLIGIQNPSHIKYPDSTEELVRKIQSENITTNNDLTASLQDNRVFPTETLTRNLTSGAATFGAAVATGPAPLTAEEKHERMRIIARLTRLSQKKGFPPIQWKHDSTLAELRRANNVASYAGRAQFTVDILKRGTVFIAKAAEALVAQYPNEYIDLEGYSEHLYTTIGQYDNLLHDIFEFYSDSFSEVNPVVTYLTAIGSNAAMYSISRKMVKAKEKITRAFSGMKRRRAAQAFANKRPKIFGDEMSGPEDSENEDRFERRSNPAPTPQPPANPGVAKSDPLKDDSSFATLNTILHESSSMPLGKTDPEPPRIAPAEPAKQETEVAEAAKAEDLKALLVATETPEAGATEKEVNKLKIDLESVVST